MNDFINNIEDKLKHSRRFTDDEVYKLFSKISLDNPIYKHLFKYSNFRATVSCLHLSKPTIINLIKMYDCKFKFDAIEYDLEYYTLEDKKILKDYIKAPDVLNRYGTSGIWDLCNYLDFFEPVGYNHEELIKYVYKVIEVGLSQDFRDLFHNLPFTQQEALSPEYTIISLIES